MSVLPQESVSYISATVFAWEADLPPVHKLVLLAWADGSGSVERVAERTGMPSGSVAHATDWLDKQGWFLRMWECASDRHFGSIKKPGTNHKPVPAGVRARIMKRDGYRCRHCGTEDNLTLDHIKPRSRGGTNDDDNLQVLCSPCNSRKGRRDDSVMAA